MDSKILEIYGLQYQNSRLIKFKNVKYRKNYICSKKKSKEINGFNEITNKFHFFSLLQINFEKIILHLPSSKFN